jgi:serine/threonine-protein kinase HipA
MSDLKYCPCSLAPLKEGNKGYTASSLKKLFGGRKVNPFSDLNIENATFPTQLQPAKRLSISGMQFKLSLVLDGNRLRLIRDGERGQYILKPAWASGLSNIDDMPANEHLTMQLAEQVFGIATAPNALIFLENNHPAYLTKRIDYFPDGQKAGMEDFATLAGKTAQRNGADFKYEGSYQDLFPILEQHTTTYAVQRLRLFQLILFNYLTANGDAHLKNFSLLQSAYGDFRLAPAYDLMCTRLHLPNDTDLAFKDGLFSEHYETERFQANGFYAYDDFYELGLKVGIPEKVVARTLADYGSDKKEAQALHLIERSYLSSELKAQYQAIFQDRVRKRLRYRFKA